MLNMDEPVRQVVSGGFKLQDTITSCLAVSILVEYDPIKLVHLENKGLHFRCCAQQVQA